MLPISNSNCCALNKPQIGSIAAIMAVSLATLAIGAYLTQVVSPTIAYSVIGGGGALFLGDLIFLAICLAKKKQVLSTEPDIEEASQTTGPKTPEPPKKCEKEEEFLVTPIKKESSLQTRYLYKPDRNLIVNYCKELGDEEKARQRLTLNGSKPGDYVLVQTKESEFKVLFLGNDLKVYEQIFKDPAIWHGTIYNRAYEWMARPILPADSSLNRDAIHSSMMGYRNLAILKELDGGEHSSNLSSVGVIQGFVNWLRGHTGKIRFEPTMLLKIVGHRFGLLGKYSYTYQGANAGRPRSCEVDYEGFSSEDGRSVIMQDILNYLPTSTLDPMVKQKISWMCHNAFVTKSSGSNPSTPTLLHLLDQGVPITILTGWPGHAVNITMTKESLIFSNKGDEAGKNPGMRIFKITKPVTAKTLEALFTYNKKMDFPADGRRSALEELLGLKFERVLKGAFQKVGCCVFANNSLCFKAGLMLLGISDEKAKEEHLACKQKSRLEWLNAIFTLIDKSEPDESLYTELYFCLLLLTLKLSTKKTYLKRETAIDNQVLEKIKKKVSSLQFHGESHPYLPLILEFMDKKYTYTKLAPSHRKAVTDSINAYGNHYFAKARV